MIWFACKECGKRQRRPEEAAGTLVFCSCGAGNRVPWESTVPVPAEQAEPASVPATPWGGPAQRPAEPGAEDEPAPRRSRRPVRRTRDPGHCLNHPEASSTKTCDECREAFCDSCVVPLQDRTLCGPCKNFRLRSLQRALQPSAFAIITLIGGVVSGPFAFCLMGALAAGEKVPLNVSAMFGTLGVGCPFVTLLLGLKALWDINHQPRLGGRGLAVLGMTMAATGLLWCLTLLMLYVYQHVFGG
jgi:hypothetical protein